MFRLLILMLLSTSCTVDANTEKTIFLGPPAVDIPSAYPSLEALRLDSLTPDNGLIRTHLEAQFPSSLYPNGRPTWLILDGLSEGQRYEVRVCWAATQPTAFKLDTYDLPAVFDTPYLISELMEYSSSHQSGADNYDQVNAEADVRLSKSPRVVIRSGESSVLLLRILVAADYYTTNKALMSNVPPVYVDVILDPFIFDILPQSLVPTVGYIIVIATLSWFVAQQISSWTCDVATEPSQKKDQ